MACYPPRAPSHLARLSGSVGTFQQLQNMPQEVSKSKPNAQGVPDRFPTLPPRAPWETLSSPGCCLTVRILCYQSAKGMFSALPRLMTTSVKKCTTDAAGHKSDFACETERIEQGFGLISVHGISRNFFDNSLIDSIGQNKQSRKSVEILGRRWSPINSRSVLLESSIGRAPFCLGSRPLHATSKAFLFEYFTIFTCKIPLLNED